MVSSLMISQLCQAIMFGAQLTPPEQSSVGYCSIIARESLTREAVGWASLSPTSKR